MMNITCEIIDEERAENKEKKIMGDEVQNCKVLKEVCGKKHEGKCLAGREGCFGCGGTGYKMRDCPKAKAMRREGKKVSTSGSNEINQKKNSFYALQVRDEQECPLNVATVHLVQLPIEFHEING
uniref:CCHC-type domain-containing protein n=1 Tax=Solanum tuberosum TaxID=4113 RepID=M1DF30_SOLTU